MTSRLIEASDTERWRLEHNLHDGAQQRLTALAVRLGIVSERIRDDPDGAASTLPEQLVAHRLQLKCARAGNGSAPPH